MNKITLEEQIQQMIDRAPALKSYMDKFEAKYESGRLMIKSEPKDANSSFDELKLSRQNVPDTISSFSR